MSDQSPLSPEARAKLATAVSQSSESEDWWFHRLKTRDQVVEVIKRVVTGVYSEGFVHAGNFAYLSLLAVFAFFIVAAAIAGLFGQTQTGIELIQAFFQTVPPRVAAALSGPIESAMTARSGPVLWFSAVVGLWTTTSLIETIRDILNKSYGTQSHRPFWHYRLGSIAVVILAVFMAMLAFSAQVLVSTLGEFWDEIFPSDMTLPTIISVGQLFPFLLLFATIYILFKILTPSKYNIKAYPKWPGAVLVSLWWLVCTTIFPLFLSKVANYDLTYGSLAGVMVALIFFYLIGLGMVSGAQLNAALANTKETGSEHHGDNDDHYADNSDEISNRSKL